MTPAAHVAAHVSPCCAHALYDGAWLLCAGQTAVHQARQNLISFTLTSQLQLHEAPLSCLKHVQLRQSVRVACDIQLVISSFAGLTCSALSWEAWLCQPAAEASCCTPQNKQAQQSIMPGLLSTEKDVDHLTGFCAGCRCWQHGKCARLG